MNDPVLYLFLGYVAGLFTALLLWLFGSGWEKDKKPIHLRLPVGTPHPDNEKARAYQDPVVKAQMRANMERERHKYG